MSIYEPAEWQWDFGDGSGSSERNPEHVYTTPGAYSVCLRVRNGNGADSICYVVNVGVSSENEARPLNLEVAVAPNPFRSVLAFSVPETEPWQLVRAVLYDQAGREVAQTSWRGGHGNWQLEQLPAGVYFYDVRDAAGRRGVGRVLKY